MAAAAVYERLLRRSYERSSLARGVAGRGFRRDLRFPSGDPAGGPERLGYVSRAPQPDRRHLQDNPPGDHLAAVWRETRAELRESVPDTTFRIWLAPLGPVAYRD